jgi:hypothetical protein
MRRELLDERHELGRRAVGAAARRQRQLDACEVEEVRALAGVEPERARECVEHLRRRLDVAPLLEPRVPREAHAGELGELLAPQARRAAAAAGLETRVLRRDLGAAPAQEIRELGPALL